MRRNDASGGGTMGTDRYKRIMRQIEDAMSAVSFAEEGEPEAARALFTRERRVLLALRDGAIDDRTLKYAFHAAQRIGARLDILFITQSGTGNPSATPRFREFESELGAAGIPYQIAKRTGCLKQEIVDYTNREKDILFVVVESPDSLDADCAPKDSRLAELWKSLRCPLVVVMDEAKT